MMVVQQGLDTPLIEAMDTLRFNATSPYGTALKTGGRVVIEDIALADRPGVPLSLASTLLTAGIRAFQSTPLVTTSGKVTGVVSTYFSSPHSFSAREFRLLDPLANQTGNYVERTSIDGVMKARTEQFEAALQNAPLAICRVDSSFRVRHANPAAVCIFGDIEIPGRNFEEALQGIWNREYTDEIVRKCRRTLFTGECCHLEQQAAWRHGARELEHYEWHVRRVDLPEKEYGILCYIRDVSPSVKRLNDMREQEDQHRRVVRLAAAQQVASSLAHEINNPLAAVTNVLYLLGKGNTLDPAAQQLVRSASAELMRVTRIVKQTLSYHRGGRAFQEVDVSALVGERLAAFADRFVASGVEVVKKIAPQVGTLGFAEEVGQAIDNLLLNALEAMPQGGCIAIAVKKSRRWNHNGPPGARLTVADTGCGIPLQNSRRIFDAFSTTKPEKGRGLGLWIVRGIIAKYEGSISVRSRVTPGRSGTVVSIVWPRTIPPL